MSGVLDIYLRTIGHKIYRLITTSESGGNEALGLVPTPVVKRERVRGLMVPPTEKNFQLLGHELTGDHIMYVREQLNLSDQIQHLGITYKIITEMPAPMYLLGNSWAYILKRLPKVEQDVPGDAIVPGFELVLGLADSLDVGDEFTSNMSADEITLDCADTMTVADSISTAMAFSLALGDSVAVEDSISESMAFSEAISDTVDVEDSVIIV